MQREKIPDPAFQRRADGFQMVGTFGQNKYLSPLAETALDLGGNRLRAAGVACHLPEYILYASLGGHVDPGGYHAWHNSQVMRGTVGLGGSVPDRSALHENDRLLSIAANRCRGEAQHVLGLGALEDFLERECRKVMAFVNDDVPIIFDQFADFALTRK